MNRHRDKGKLPPFVPLLVATLASPAWRSTTPSARLLYIALKARYSIKYHNNGRLYLSTRRAAKETGLNKDTVAKGFHELVHYGFIVMHERGSLGWEGKGKAPHWRLTELGYMHEPPTNEFNRWDGTLFDGPKKENPVRKSRTGRPKRSDIPAPEKPGHLPAGPSEKFGHIAQGACPNLSDITSLTIPKRESRSAPPQGAEASGPAYLIEALMHSRSCSREEAAAFVRSQPDAGAQ